MNLRTEQFLKISLSLIKYHVKNSRKCGWMKISIKRHPFEYKTELEVTVGNCLFTYIEHEREDILPSKKNHVAGLFREFTETKIFYKITLASVPDRQWMYKIWLRHALIYVNTGTLCIFSRDGRVVSLSLGLGYLGAPLWHLCHCIYEKENCCWEDII